MKFRKYILLLGFVLLRMITVSQNEVKPFKFWQLTGLSGKAMFRGNYRTSETSNGDYYARRADAFFNGLFQVRTKSFFIHPNFCEVRLNADYNPQSRRDNYIGVPDYTEKSSSGGLDFSAQFLKKKAFNFATTVNLNNTIQNIENITRIRSKTRQYGVSANYNNKVVPISVAYNYSKLEQQTLGSERIYRLSQKIFNANASKTFTEYDHTNLAYYHTENRSSLIDSTSGGYQPFVVLATLDNIDFTNDLAFDKQRLYTLSSGVTKSEERGTYLFNRLQAIERLNIVLPRRFVFTGIYNWGQIEGNQYIVNTKWVQTALTHQLFESLRTRLFYDYNENNQKDAYIDHRNRFGIDLGYTKKIYKGTLNINYNYTKEYQKLTVTSPDILVLREQYVLIDNEVILLRRPNININSIVVKDVTGNFIYQRWNGTSGDYELFVQGTYIEIRRMPGGNIPNNGSVYIDYTAAQGGTNKFNLDVHSLSGNVALFKNILNMYYRFSSQSYNDLSASESKVFNYYTRHVIGARVEYKLMRGGVEYEYYKSTIVPYQGMKYYLAFQKSLSKLTFSINGDLIDYQMTDENARRRDYILNTKLAYALFRNLRVDLDYMYRRMIMKGNSLDYHTAKIELTSSFRKLFISGGANFYFNQNNNTKTVFKGIYIQVTRNF